MHNNRTAVFCVVHTACVATQWCGKHFSAAVNQHVTTSEVEFSVGDTLRPYNEDLKQLDLELSRVLELAVAAEN
jgi:hypothetical protein